jgi:hypothetical protein
VRSPEETVILIAGGLTVAVLAFVVSWRRWDDAIEVLNVPLPLLKFLGVRFQRGIDGRLHLLALPFHVRLALSLISGLSAAILVTLMHLYVF